MIDFLIIIGVTIGLTISVVGGIWFGFKLVDFATDGELSRLLR